MVWNKHASAFILIPRSHVMDSCTNHNIPSSLTTYVSYTPTRCWAFLLNISPRISCVHPPTLPPHHTVGSSSEQSAKYSSDPSPPLMDDQGCSARGWKAPRLWTLGVVCLAPMRFASEPRSRARFAFWFLDLKMFQLSNFTRDERSTKSSLDKGSERQNLQSVHERD